MLPTPPVKSPCISKRLLHAYGNMYRQQPNVQTHTLHTVTLTYIGKSARGGRGQPPPPAEAKPSLAAKLAPEGRHAFLDAI